MIHQQKDSRRIVKRGRKSFKDGLREHVAGKKELEEKKGGEIHGAICFSFRLRLSSLRSTTPATIAKLSTLKFAPRD